MEEICNEKGFSFLGFSVKSNCYFTLGTSKAPSFMNRRSRVSKIRVTRLEGGWDDDGCVLVRIVSSAISQASNKE